MCTKCESLPPGVRESLEDFLSDIFAEALVSQAVATTNRLVAKNRGRVAVLNGPGADKVRERWIKALEARGDEGTFTCEHIELPRTAFGRAAVGRDGFVWCGECSEKEYDGVDIRPVCDLCGREPKPREQFARVMVQQHYVLILTVACRQCHVRDVTAAFTAAHVN